MDTIKAIYTSLEKVMDPEIPVLNVLEMGMITDIQQDETGIHIKMIPTFSACPAIAVIKQSISDTVSKDLQLPVEVTVDAGIQWNSNRLTATAKEKLRGFGIAAPPVHHGEIEADMLLHVTCPHCGSDNTFMRSPFGATLCRAMHFCRQCGMMFEQFKPLT